MFGKQSIPSIALSMCIVISVSATSYFSNMNAFDLTGSVGFSINGMNPSDSFGFSVGEAGDINNDGISDMLIGARGFSSSRGAVYVVYGNGNQLPNIDLSTTTISSTKQGFTITGENAEDRLGTTVERAGDINNDGIDDILVGANGYPSNAGNGAVYVIYGKSHGLSDINLATTDLYNTHQGFKIIGESGSSLGTSIKYAGDVNGDGIDDIILGGFGTSGKIGAAYIIFGKTGRLPNIDLSTADLSGSRQGFKISGAYTSGALVQGYFGCSVSNAGDLNNDGIDDVVIAARRMFSGAGAAYIVYGSRTGLTNIDLNVIDLYTSKRGFKIIGSSFSYQFGFMLECAGDVNNDDIMDIVIGDNGVSTNIVASGTVYILFGRDGGYPDIDLSQTSLSASQRGFQIFGAATNDHLGYIQNFAGDLDNDGIDDLVVGVSNAFQNTGAVYVILGKSAGFSDIYLSATDLAAFRQGFQITGGQPNDKFGTAVSRIGDVNNDGVDDMIIGASQVNSLAGAAYVVFGINSKPYIGQTTPGNILSFFIFSNALC